VPLLSLEAKHGGSVKVKSYGASLDRRRAASVRPSIVIGIDKTLVWSCSTSSIPPRQIPRLVVLHNF
jgi:hypothetical protein